MYAKKMFYLVVLFFICLILIVPGSAAASEDDEEITLTLDEAISRAIRYSDTLEKTELSTDMAQDSLRDAQVNWNPAWVTDYVEGTEQYYIALLNARYNYDAAKKNEEIQKDSIASETRNKYYDLLQSIKNVEQKKKELEAAERELYVAQAKYQFGLVCWSDVQQACISESDAQASLTAAENDLDTSYRSFNRQVGLNTDERPVLKDVPVYSEMEVANLSSTIKGIIEESPETWMTEESLEIQERLLNYPGSSEQDELSFEQAEINAELQEINSIEALYGVYYNIVSLEQSYNSAVLNLEIAEKDLKNTELKFSVGLVTKTDLINAQLTCLKQENSLFSIICQHELLKIEFEQPWSS